jgi:hypothetical protein
VLAAPGPFSCAPVVKGVETLLGSADGNSWTPRAERVAPLFVRQLAVLISQLRSSTYYYVVCNCHLLFVRGRGADRPDVGRLLSSAAGGTSAGYHWSL